MLPPAPVVPPEAVRMGPLVTKLIVDPFKNMLLVTAEPTVPEPAALAVMVTAVPVPSVRVPPKLFVPTASSDTTPPSPLPAAVTLILAVVL